MRRPMMRAPIVSYKHQRQTALTYIGGGANQVITLYTGTGPGSVGTVGLVPAGNKVYSCDVSVNFIPSSAGNSGTINWMLVHMRSDQDESTLFAPTSAADWTNIGLSVARNQVIKSFLSLVGTNDAGPRIWNMHIKIPKQWHRVREGDRLIIIFDCDEAGPLAIGTRYKSYS